MGTKAGGRILVAVSPAGQPVVRAMLRGREADFVTSYAEAAATLTRRHYAVVVVGLHFGDSRMLDMIRLVHEIEPAARVVAVMGSETRLGAAALAGVQTALGTLGVEGLVDLTHAGREPMALRSPS